MTRICIGQLVRPDATLLTEALTAEYHGPSFGYDWWSEQQDGISPLDEITGATYARWRFEGEAQWKVVYYWPHGPGHMPAYVDNTGEGRFTCMTGDGGIDQDAVARQLREVAAAV